MAGVLRRCPELVIVPMDTAHYRKVSYGLLRLIEKCAGPTCTVEKASIDDFYVFVPDAIPDASGAVPPVAGLQGCGTGVGALGTSYSASSSATMPVASASAAAESAVSATRLFTDVGSTRCVLGVGGTRELTAAEAGAGMATLLPGVRAAVGIMSSVRAAMRMQYGGMTCGCAVASNKLLARMASPVVKPDGQGILLPAEAPGLLSRFPLRSVPGLKAQLGDAVEGKLRSWIAAGPLEVLSTAGLRLLATELPVASPPSVPYAPDQIRGELTLGQLQSIPLTTLERWVGAKHARFLHEVCRGVDASPVAAYTPPQTIICERSFNPLRSHAEVLAWLQSLAAQLVERLVEDSAEFERLPQRLSVSHRIGNTSRALTSRTAPMPAAVLKLLRARLEQSSPAATNETTAAAEFGLTQGAPAGEVCEERSAALTGAVTAIVEQAAAILKAAHPDPPAATKLTSGADVLQHGAEYTTLVVGATAFQKFVRSGSAGSIATFFRPPTHATGGGTADFGAGAGSGTSLVGSKRKRPEAASELTAPETAGPTAVTADTTPALDAPSSVLPPATYALHSWNSDEDVGWDDVGPDLGVGRAGAEDANPRSW